MNENENKGFWYADWSFPLFVGLLSSGVFAGTHMYYLYGIGAFNEVAFVSMLRSGSRRRHPRTVRQHSARRSAHSVSGW